MRTSGFTLIEILTVIALSLLLLAGSMGVYINYNRARALEVGTQNVVSLLKEARSKTLASKNASTYGVHFETGRVVLFKGNVFSEPQAENREYTLPGNVVIATIDLNGGGSDVIFDRLTGETQQFGTSTLSISASSSTKNVIILKTGVVEF